jgi:segregation and condensation protein B
MVPPRLKLVSSERDLSLQDEADLAPRDDAVPVDALASLAALQSAAASAAAKRTLEALLFAASAPLDLASLARHLPADTDVAQLIAQLQSEFATRGVNLVHVSGGYAFRTAQDLSHLLERHAVEERKLSRAALETLAIIAYHQPVTRAEVEEIRGVSTSKGSLDVLLETRWIRPRGRRRAPGRPITYGTTAEFLNHFGLDAIKDLPGLAELKGAGLLDGNLPPDFKVPEPSDLAALMPDELPLESSDEPEAETDPDLFAPLPDEDDDATSEA